MLRLNPETGDMDDKTRVVDRALHSWRLDGMDHVERTLAETIRVCRSQVVILQGAPEWIPENLCPAHLSPLRLLRVGCSRVVDRSRAVPCWAMASNAPAARRDQGDPSSPAAALVPGSLSAIGFDFVALIAKRGPNKGQA